MKLLSSIAFFCLLALSLFSAKAQEPAGAFAWACQATGRNSMQCQVKNTGRVETDMCVDVIKVCKGGDHIATLCSGSMRPGESAPKVISNFEPKVKIFEKCMGIEYRNKIISRVP